MKWRGDVSGRWPHRRAGFAGIVLAGWLATAAVAEAAGEAPAPPAPESAAGAATAGEASHDGRRKVALLIGIGAYRGAAALRNPPRDVAAVGERLRRIGFAVTTLPDAGKAEIERAVSTFAAGADGADIALVYYSGHGVQIAGENYALPVDYDPGQPARAQLVSINGLIQRLADAARAKVVLLDACRNNPFLARLDGADARPSGKGMAPIAIEPAPGGDAAGNAHGLIVGYATQANDTADDGSGQLSPYAEALLAAASNADEDFNAILVRTAGMVMTATGGRQHPEHRVAMTRPLYLLSRKTPLACDLLAAETDNNIALPGVEFDKIQVHAALAACEADSRAHPDNPRLLHNLGRVLDKAGRDSEAVAIYERAAAMGYDWSMNNLGVMYFNGEGVAIRPDKAIGYLRAAFDRGNRQALSNYSGTDLGSLFADAPVRTRALQAALAAQGHAAGAEGQFDAITRAAVEAFKAERGFAGPGVTFQVIDRLGAVEAVFRSEPRARP